MITQNLFNKRPKTFMDYEPGKIPKKSEWKTQTITETKTHDPFTSNVKLVGDDVTEKDYDTFFEGFNDPYGEKRKQELQQKEQERKEKFAKIRANADKRDWSSQSTSAPFLQGFNHDAENKRMLDLFKEKTTNIVNSHFPDNADHTLNEWKSIFRSPQFEGELKPKEQRPNSAPAITNAINRNLNAKNEFEHAIGDPKKEPAMVQYSNDKNASDFTEVLGNTLKRSFFEAFAPD